MQIVVDRQDLLTVLKRSGAAVSPSDMLAYRQAVLVHCAGSPLTIGATNGPLSVICKCPGEVKEPGSAVLNHRRLSAIVSEMPPGSIEVTVNPKLQVSFKSGSSKRKFTMTSSDPADYPALLGEKPGEPMYSVESKILQQAAGEVSFGIDKAYTDGVLLAPSSGGIGKELMFQVVSLSSRQMSVATGWFTVITQREDCLLPSNLLEAIDTLTNDDTALVLSQDDKKIFVQTADGGTLIVASRLVASFPPVWRVILDNAPPDKRFKVSSEKFLESVRAVSVAADFVEGAERFVQIDVAYEASAGCVISTRKSEKNFGEDELEVSDVPQGGGAFRFHMDGHLLSQALRSFSPVELDLYYDAINGQETLCLKNESLCIMLTPVTEIKAKEKK